MTELTAADYSLLSWVHQTGISANSLSIRFHHGSLIVSCQTIEVAGKLWEKRSLLQMSGRELCFRVNDVFYVGSMLA